MSAYPKAIESEIEHEKLRMKKLYEDLKIHQTLDEFFKIYSEIHSIQVSVYAKKQRLSNIGNSFITTQKIPKEVTF
jgi:hypothetical protein